MTRKMILLAAVAAAAALIAIGVALAQGPSPSSSVAFAPAQPRTASTATTLRASVGPGFTISLKRNGKKVVRLKAGAYRVLVSDASSEHNFALKRVGGATRTLTTVGFTGTRTVQVRLTNGRWEFFCAPHEPVMRGFIAVGAPASTTAAKAGTTTTTTTTTTVRDDDDDHRGRGEAEPGDDHGGHGEAEPGDDHGGHSGHGSDD